MLNQRQPRDSEVKAAQALGLAELRCGRHPIRDESGARRGQIFVSSVWTLRILPAFAPRGILTVVTADGMEFRGEKSKGWRKGVLRSNGNELISANVPKTVEPILESMPLLVKSDASTLDGISYELIWNSTELSGCMQFSNPHSEVLRKMETTCLALAVSLTKQSDDHKLFKFVKDWGRYARDRV